PRHLVKDLPRYDSNVDFLVQSQACYRLHHRAQKRKNPEAGLRGLVIQFNVDPDLVTRRAEFPAVVAAGPAGITRTSSSCSLGNSIGQLSGVKQNDFAQKPTSWSRGSLS